MRIVVLQGPQPGVAFSLADGQFVAGREPGVDIHLPSRRVSRRHCVFEVQGAICVVRDLGSSNGVKVDGQKVEAAQLVHGNRVQVGDCLLALDHPQTAAPQPQAPQPQQQQPQHQPPQEAAPPPLQPINLPEEEEDPDATRFRPVPQRQDAAPIAPDDQSGEAPWAGGGGGFGGGDAGDAGDAGPPPWEVAELGAQQPAPSGVAMSGPTLTGDAAFADGGFGGADGGFGGAEGGFGGAEGGFGGGGAFGGDSGGAFGGDGADAGFGGGGQAVTNAPPASPAEGGGGDKLGGLRDKLKVVPWPVLLGGLMTACVMFLVFLPVVGLWGVIGSANSSIEEIAIERGIALAESLGNRNARAMANAERLGMEMSPVKGKAGVKRAILANTGGTVLAPPEKAHTTISSKEIFKLVTKERKAVYQWMDDEPYVAIAVPIRGQVTEGGPVQIIGFSYLVYDAAGVADSIGRPTVRVVMFAITLGVTMVLLGIGLYRLAALPVAQLREDTELVLRGHMSEVKSPLKWKQLEDLAHSINRVFARAREGGSVAPAEDKRLGVLVQASAYPVVAMDGGGRVTHINDAALYVFQARREDARDASIIELMTDPAMSAKITSMLRIVGSGKAAVVAEPAVVGGEQRRITIAGERNAAGDALEFALMVIA